MVLISGLILFNATEMAQSRQEIFGVLAHGHHEGPAWEERDRRDQKDGRDGKQTASGQQGATGHYVRGTRAVSGRQRQPRNRLATSKPATIIS